MQAPMTSAGRRRRARPCATTTGARSGWPGRWPGRGRGRRCSWWAAAAGHHPGLSHPLGVPGAGLPGAGDPRVLEPPAPGEGAGLALPRAGAGGRGRGGCGVRVAVLLRGHGAQALRGQEQPERAGDPLPLRPVPRRPLRLREAQPRGQHRLPHAGVAPGGGLRGVGRPPAGGGGRGAPHPLVLLPGPGLGGLRRAPPPWRRCAPSSTGR